MSRYDILKINLTILLGVFCGYLISQNISGSNTTNRDVASIPSHYKLGADFSSQNYFDLELNVVSLANDPDKASLIELKITAKKDFPNKISFQWNKHKNHSINDEYTGVIPALKSGDVFRREIQVIGFYKSNQSHVSLTIKGVLDKSVVDRNAIVASQVDQTFEHIVQEAAKNRRQKNNNDVDTQSKVSSNPLDRFKPENVIK